MTIQDLHMENNAFRDMIVQHKEAIAKYDRAIKANENEIGKLAGMIRSPEAHDCELCMGECNA